jgi:hypothetical protein
MPVTSVAIRASRSHSIAGSAKVTENPESTAERMICALKSACH